MWSAAGSGFDLSMLHWLNALVGRSINLDNGIGSLADNELLDAVFVSGYWWYWFRKSDTATATRTREHVLCTLCAGIVAISVARMLALALPFRVRPRFEPALQFVVPAGKPIDLLAWSAFPSDHAVMFSALAVGLCFISWRTGLIAILYTIFIVCLPRIYLGLHYPTDIVAGLALGALLGYCANVSALGKNFATMALRWQSASPGGFYLALFIVSFEFATMFDSLRAIATAAARIGGHLAAAL
jgi:undecaprenyl-diphosphatase